MTKYPTMNFPLQKCSWKLLFSFERFQIPINLLPMNKLSLAFLQNFLKYPKPLIFLRNNSLRLFFGSVWIRLMIRLLLNVHVLMFFFSRTLLRKCQPKKNVVAKKIEMKLKKKPCFSSCVSPPWYSTLAANFACGECETALLWVFEELFSGLNFSSSSFPLSGYSKFYRKQLEKGAKNGLQKTNGSSWLHSQK